jgi:hypothetical protein
VGLCLQWRAHAFGQESTKLGTFGFIDHDISSCLGSMILVVLGHAACHARHKPRVAVHGLVTLIRKCFTFVRDSEKLVIGTRKSMPNGTASTQRLDTQNVIQMKAFITRDGSCGERFRQDNVSSQSRNRRTVHAKSTR